MGKHERECGEYLTPDFQICRHGIGHHPHTCNRHTDGVTVGMMARCCHCNHYDPWSKWVKYGYEKGENDGEQ